MHKQQIAQALQNPNGLDEQSLDGLKLLLEEYPFFQAGRMLWVKNLHLLGHIRYNNELKLAAAHIADRAKLFALIHAPVATAPVFVAVDSPPALEEEQGGMVDDYLG